MTRKEEKKKEEDKWKELVSCNEENKKKLKSIKILIKVPPTEKKTAEEDEKEIANLVDEKPSARTGNLRSRRKTNSKYASSVSEDTSKPEFISSLTKEEIEEDYIYLVEESLRRIKDRYK